MKIFISWSGERSRAVADFFRTWIKCVLQATKPWVSTRDIDRGAVWFNEIGGQLRDTSIGIICLTKENRNRPWILFEAGALAKGLNSSRVCCFLIDLNPSDVEDPLAQFNLTKPTREDLWELVRTLNSHLQNECLDDRTLAQIFETYWPQFLDGFRNAISSTPDAEAQAIAPRSSEAILAEILEHTRSLQSRLFGLELEMKHMQNGGLSTRETRGRTQPLFHIDRLMDVAVDMKRAGMPHHLIESKLASLGADGELAWNIWQNLNGIIPTATTSTSCTTSGEIDIDL